ncbi:MAG: glycoside hydrolase family 16 protein [Prolixibacteraceae bacterium]
MIFFNKIRSTEVIEKERLQLWNDYQTYKEVEQSADLKTYLALKEKVESKPFLENKKSIESLRYKGSSIEKMQKQFEKLEANRKLRRYFAALSSSELERFRTIGESGEMVNLADLEKFVRQGGYKAELAKFKELKKADKQNVDTWENTEAYKKKNQFEDLKTSSNVLFYRKYAKSKSYKNFLTIDDSALLHQYEDLKSEIGSDKFEDRKIYLQNAKRYEDTDDFKVLTHFQQLDKDDKIQLYLKYNDTDAFRFFREWTPTFNENFDSIDTKIWSFITPIAEKGPQRNFSIKNQLHYSNGSDNFDFENGIMTLETKKEMVEGLYWDAQYGFVPKVFNYASGLMHTIDGFMQEYGLFEVKVKTSKVKGVLSSISLVDADEDICIRIFSANHAKPHGGLISTNRQDKELNPVTFSVFSKGYVLIRLIWTREKLEWFVNDKSMGSISSNVPHVPLALRIESEVLKETNNLPHRLDVDWIKCYKAN